MDSQEVIVSANGRPEVFHGPVMQCSTALALPCLPRDLIGLAFVPDSPQPLPPLYLPALRMLTFGPLVTSLPREGLQAPELLVLQTAGANLLTTLPATLFTNATRVQDVSITASHNLTTIEPGVFRPLASNLTTIFLQGLGVERLPPGTLSGFPQLGYLSMEAGRLVDLPADFATNCPSLTGLFLGANRLTRSPQQVLRDSPLLTGLALYGNQLTELSPIAHLHRLEYLNVANNRIASLELDCSSLTRLQANINHLTSLTFLERPGVPGVACPRLRELFVGNNNLTTAESLRAVGPALTVLGLEYNELTAFPWALLPTWPALLTLDVTHNPIGGVADLVVPNTLRTLSVSHSRLTGLALRPLNPLLPAGLTVLQAAFCQLAYFAPSNASSFSALAYIYLNTNLLVDLPELNSPSFINASSNLLTTFDPVAWFIVPATQAFGFFSTIDVSNNAIATVPGSLCPDPRHARRGLIYFSSVTLQHNRLTTFDIHAFAGCSGLNELDLGHNRIATVVAPDGIVVPTLLTLALNNNHISVLPRDAFNYPSLLELDLSENLLREVQTQLWGSTFRFSAEGWHSTYGTSLQFAFGDSPHIILRDNPLLRRVPKNAFAGLPHSVFVELGAPHLATCCGLEYLIEPGARFVTDNGTTCMLNGVKQQLRQLRDRVICPCNTLNNTVAFGELGCQERARVLLEDGTCQPLCPFGTRIEPILSPGLTVTTCNYTDVQTKRHKRRILLTTACRACYVRNCSQCPSDPTRCGRCLGSLLPNFDGTECVETCPPGFFAVPDSYCHRCTVSSCSQCNATTCLECEDGFRLLTNACLATCPPGYGDVDGKRCVPCTVAGCVVCPPSNNTASCTACSAGLLLLRGSSCVESCPSGFVRLEGPPASCARRAGLKTTDVGLPTKFIALIVIAVVGLLVAVGLLLRKRLVHRYSLAQTGLREKLLDTQQEVIALKTAWEIEEDELELGEVIGRGAFGKVHKATWRGIPVAVKLLPAQDLALEDASVEIEFMQTLRHPNIITFFGAGQKRDGGVFLVTELAQNSLQRLLETSPAIAWAQKYQFALDVAVGMAKIHSLGRIHRDLKSGNVLVADNFQLKIADFGTSKIQERSMAVVDIDGRADARGGMTRFVGTPLWMAPEILQGHTYGEAADVYSYAIVLFEIAAQRLPWEEVQGSFLVNKLSKLVSSGSRPEFGSAVPAAWAKLANACWATDPQARPSFEEVAARLTSLVELGRHEQQPPSAP